jgi:hypothetical protein
MKDVILSTRTKRTAMSQTRAMLDVALPKDISTIVYAYFASGSHTFYELAKNGEGEAITEIMDSSQNNALLGAAVGGHIELVRLMLSKGYSSREALIGACYGGHMDIVVLAIENGANDWNYGLSEACKGGHMEIALFMIDNGANHWDLGMEGCCISGNVELAQLMIGKGAKIPRASSIAHNKRHPKLIELLRAYQARLES